MADAVDIYVSTVCIAAGTSLLEAIPDAIVEKCSRSGEWVFTLALRANCTSVEGHPIGTLLLIYLMFLFFADMIDGAFTGLTRKSNAPYYIIHSMWRTPTRCHQCTIVLAFKRTAMVPVAATKQFWVRFAGELII